MSSRSASHRPKHVQRAQEMSHYHWGQFQTHALHIVPSIGTTVSVVTLHGWQNSLQKADHSAKPGNATVNRQSMSVRQLLAGPIKQNRPGVTFQSVFHNPLTYLKKPGIANIIPCSYNYYLYCNSTVLNSSNMYSLMPGCLLYAKLQSLICKLAIACNIDVHTCTS